MSEKIRVDVGIDPGAKGAFAFVNFDKQVCEFIDVELDSDKLITFGFVQNIVDTADKYRVHTVTLERIWAFPGQNIHAVSRQIATYTQLWLASKFWLNTRPELVEPMKWKKALGLTVPKGTPKIERKRVVLNWCREQFPWVKGINLQKHDGRADALAIAYYNWVK